MRGVELAVANPQFVRRLVMSRDLTPVYGANPQFTRRFVTNCEFTMP
jgi:hypothetical protein